MYNAFIHITQWEYSEALGYLETYTDRQDITDYQRLIALTNIAACLVFLGQYEKAQSVLVELVNVTKKEGHSLLLSNAYELSAQAAFFLGDLQTTDKHLSNGFDVAKSGSSAHLYLKKWQNLLQLEQSKGKKSYTGLKRVREEAVGLGLWETVRECDFYIAKYQKNLDLFSFVLFGTPHTSYKNRLLELYQSDVTLPDEIQFALPFRRTRELSDLNSVLNLNSLQLKEFEKPIEKIGSLFHKTLLALSSDFYRPFRV